MSLTHENVRAILKIIDETPYDEVRLEIDDLKLHVSRHGVGGLLESVEPLSQSAVSAHSSSAAPLPRKQAPLLEQAAQPQLAEGLVAVRAPMLGTFYRAPAPGKRPFVEVGDKVGVDDTVCLVEVMKLFQSVKAGVAGTVAKLPVENGSMVEHGQTLVLIESDQHTAGAVSQ